MQEAGYRRFKIETDPAPHAYPIPNKFDVSARKIRLASMLVQEAFEYRFKKEVVLDRPCIYGVFGGRFGGFKPLKQKCVGCMRCVQEYPHIMTVKPSDAYKKLGDSFWTPEMVYTIWNEAATGKIPVKGMGYKGAFGGEGFDGIWTDMSEIVRPTRDGVYGREYISTSVDVGRKPTSVDFTKLENQPHTLEIPVPIIFDELPAGTASEDLSESVARAADKIATMRVSRKSTDKNENARVLRIIEESEIRDYEDGKPRILEFDGEELGLFEKLRNSFESSILIARLPLGEDTAKLSCELARQGVHGLHLCADYHGWDYSPEAKHISAALKNVHQHLVREGVRDQITIIASGGVTLAEHVPKAIICGADLVALDTTVLVALQAEFRGETKDRTNCGLKPRTIDPKWGAQRLVNLMSAWHDQLIEILSAMGMRDVRRLRGDIGRSMMDTELREQSFKGIAWAA
ncbi:MAG TPA: glutamate synthase-related protein [Candidatus Dormibacteraeota bacterium]|nr:glutamate synthase-related protein [Candidatus Dormibacteraeota bacterium]